MSADLFGEFCQRNAGCFDGDARDGFDIYRLERAVRRDRHLYGCAERGDDGDGDVWWRDDELRVNG